MNANFSRGLASWRRWQWLFLVCPFLDGGFRFHALACVLQLLRHSGGPGSGSPGAWKGLRHIFPFLIECLLPRMDLPLIQTKLSLQVSLGLAAAFEQMQCFKLEFSAVRCCKLS